MLARTMIDRDPSRLEPSVSLEPEVRQDSGDDHENNRKGIAEQLFELGHRIEVHAVDAGHERRWQEDHGRDREYLYDRILLDVDEPQRRIEKEGDVVRQEPRMIDQRRQVAVETFHMLTQLRVLAHM